MTITIPNYRAASRNKTTRKHWIAYYNQLKDIEKLIWGHCPRPVKQISPAQVIIVAYYEKKRAVDVSNLDDKAIIDGLMKVGILKDDNPTENPEITKMVFANKGRNELHIIVNQL